MAATAYSTSPNRVSSTNQNQYGSYSSVNKVIINQSHHQSQQHHHMMQSGSIGGSAPPPLSIYQVKEHHNNYMMLYSRNYNYKRKTAVEMLAESKPYYVKSETVLDRNQQLNLRGAGNNTMSYALSPSRVPSSPHHSYYHQTSTMERYPRSSASRRTASSGSDMLQTKLRRLLNTEKESLMSSDDMLIPPPPRNYHDSYQTQHRSRNYQQQLSVHSEIQNQNDLSVFFPSAFLSPQSLPPKTSDDLDVLYSYSIDDSDGFLERPISPPEQYATNTAPKNEKIKKEKQRCDYLRSHSQSMAVDEFRPKTNGRIKKNPYSQNTTNSINSHKSLPDLHTQISRHSPHSEALSSCSRGNRSNRSGSSGFNRDRDSGGSSGHFTHRSEPCCKQMEKLMMTQQQQQQQKQQQQVNSNQIQHQHDYRRDSGSSTQHSGNSFYANQQQFRYDCIECRAKMRENETIFNFNFPVEVPEAFQDSYQDSNDTVRNTYYNQQQKISPITKSPSPDLSQEMLSPSSQNIELSPLSPPLGTFKRQKCLRFKNFRYYNGSVSQISNSQPNSLPVEADDDRRPILRSKSDVSDRYMNRESSAQNRRERYHQTAEESFGSNGSGGSSGYKMNKSDSLHELEQFFDQLGLDNENYTEIIVRTPKKHQRSASATLPVSSYSDNDESEHSSVVFFSDCSTIDSNRIIADSGPSYNGDQKNIQNNPANPNLYRPSEPPSIVERNARIIKWLCNCKKSRLL
ncbi:CLUMA_CG013362, isoform A [Clunio marinus]|uniref:CLUMA_CG013362, isoform A n=1 Tax=Clunio marinus TaxID=568069 RepID=A0A1J1IIR0_9DIPT|nr:CLUMA_CG013362, isoform A [Clunio marinus]